MKYFKLIFQLIVFKVAMSERPIDYTQIQTSVKKVFDLAVSKKSITTLLERKCFFEGIPSLERMRNILFFSKSYASKDSRCPEYDGHTVILDYTVDSLKELQPKLRDRRLFFTQQRFFRRICIPARCRATVGEMIDSGNFENRVLFNFLDYKGASRIKLINHNKELINQGWKMSMLRISLISVFIVIVIKVFFTLVSGLAVNRLSQERVNMLSEVELSDIYEDNSSYSDLSSKEGVNLWNKANSRLHSNALHFISKINDYFSLYNSVYYFFKAESKYYNHNNLYFISFLRFISLFFITFYSIFTNLMRMPEINGESEYSPNSFMLILLKISSFFLNFYISIEGLYFGYKMMGFLTKHNKAQFEYPFVLYLKFTFKVLSRFVSFMFIFLVFYICIREVSLYLENSNLLLYFHKIHFDNKLCYQRPDLVFVPFYLQYLNPVSPSAAEVNLGSYINIKTCFIPVHVSMNILYCVFFFNTICFICLKVRSKTLDFLIFVVLTLGNSISLLYYSVNNLPIEDKLITLQYIQGEKESFVQTHLFSSNFFFGFVVGVTIFFHKDTLSNPHLYTDINYASEELYNERNGSYMRKSYIPHVYLYKMMSILNDSKQWVWYTLMGVCIVIMVLVTLSYYLQYKIWGSLVVQESKFTKFLFIYEKKFFNISLLFLILMVYIFNPTFTSQKSWESKLFICFERISFSYFMIVDSITVFCINLLSVQQKVNWVNLTFYTISGMIISTFLGLLITINLETPIKILMKGHTNKDEDPNSSLI